MDDAIESPAEAKEIAKAILTERYPGTEQWIDLAWDVLLAGSEQPQAGVNLTEIALGIAGRSDPATRQMARELAILFEALMQKFPVLKEEILARLETSCEKSGRPAAAVEHLKKSVAQEMQKVGQEQFVVWTIQQNSVGSRERRYSRAEIEKHLLPRQSAFDVFIYHRSVFLNHASSPVTLEDRFYRLLVMFLRYKNEPLPIGECWRKAWPQAHDANYAEKEFVERFLKPAVSELRDRMVNVRGFTIPNKQRDTGYACEGDFSACVIIPERQEGEFRLEVRG